MIRQIVFDFGQVLVRFDPDYMTGRYVTDPADRELVARVLFDRLYWDALDAGTITDEEVMAAVRARLPRRLWEAAEAAYGNWYYNLPEVEGMGTLVRRCREKYRLFVLSNISRGFAAHAGEIPILQAMEGCLFSAVCGHLKPHADMFACLCDTFGLRPEETLFIDDNAANIAGAAAFGLQTYRFDGDVPRLEAFLAALGKELPLNREKEE